MYLNLVFWSKPSLSFILRCSETAIIKSILESKKKKKETETLASLTCVLKDILFSMDTFLLVKTAQTNAFVLCSTLLYNLYRVSAGFTGIGISSCRYAVVSLSPVHKGPKCRGNMRETPISKEVGGKL